MGVKIVYPNTVHSKTTHVVIIAKDKSEFHSLYFVFLKLK